MTLIRTVWAFALKLVSLSPNLAALSLKLSTVALNPVSLSLKLRPFAVKLASVSPNTSPFAPNVTARRPKLPTFARKLRTIVSAPGSGKRNNLQCRGDAKAAFFFVCRTKASLRIKPSVLSQNRELFASGVSLCVCEDSNLSRNHDQKFLRTVASTRASRASWRACSEGSAWSWSLRERCAGRAFLSARRFWSGQKPVNKTIRS